MWIDRQKLEPLKKDSPIIAWKEEGSGGFASLNAYEGPVALKSTEFEGWVDVVERIEIPFRYWMRGPINPRAQF